MRRIGPRHSRSRSIPTIRTRPPRDSSPGSRSSARDARRIPPCLAGIDARVTVTNGPRRSFLVIVRLLRYPRALQSGPSSMLDIPKPMKRARSSAARYGVALGAFSLALLVRLALETHWGADHPFTMFYPAVALAAWFGGIGPGITITLLAAGVWSWPGREPVGSLGIHGMADKAALAVFVLIGGLLAALAEAFHRARRRAEAAALATARLAAIVQSSADAVIAKTTDGIV